MAQGEFLWCDLATFDVERTLNYYRELFDWDLKSEEFPDGSVYHYASGQNDVTAGIYEMPQEYKADGMPSFWMSYIGVDDISASCERAISLGGKVLLGPAMFGNGAAIAMIEDPQGARFTFFTGSYLQPRTTKMVAGSHFWNELYTPEPEQAATFYSALLGWKMGKPDEDGRTRVNNLAGSITTAIQDCTKMPASLNKAQWSVSFACEDLENFVSRLPGAPEESGLWVKNKNGAAVCVTDPNGALFMVSQVVEQGGWFS